MHCNLRVFVTSIQSNPLNRITVVRAETAPGEGRGARVPPPFEGAPSRVALEYQSHTVAPMKSL